MANGNLKMCRACRGLIAADTATCPLCGAVSHYAAGGGSGTGALSVNWSVTLILITVNVIVYVLSLLLTKQLGTEPGEEANPFTPSGLANYYLGSVRWPEVNAGQYWRLITYAFLHGDLLHIGLNSLALFQVGRLAEEAYGGAKYLCLYLASGIVGGIAVVLSNSAAVGASGAVFGLIGAMAVYGYKRGDYYGRVIRSSMVQWLIYGLVMSFLPGISMAGHVGGLIGGGAMAWFLSDAETTATSYRSVRLWQGASVLSVLLIAASFVFAAQNMRHSFVTQAINNLSSQVFQAAYEYDRYRKLNKDEPFASYVSSFGASITTLEGAPTVDEETAAIKSRMLEALRARQAQLKQLKDESQAAPDPAQYAALDQAFADYNAWLKRKASELNVPVESLHREWQYKSEGKSGGSR
ncbi:MAG TPA: rhomboid family intramembrane serine protease [Blastocatellia bacterium]|nr:rhomboid family intramembrane serine protease [Blastocatellia bacterium]